MMRYKAAYKVELPTVPQARNGANKLREFFYQSAMRDDYVCDNICIMQNNFKRCFHVLVSEASATNPKINSIIPTLGINANVYGGPVREPLWSDEVVSFMNDIKTVMTPVAKKHCLWVLSFKDKPDMKDAYLRLKYALEKWYRDCEDVTIKFDTDPMDERERPNTFYISISYQSTTKPDIRTIASLLNLKPIFVHCYDHTSIRD